MMRNFRLLVVSVLTVVLFNGCMKEDIDELRRDLAKQAERIAALEKWAESVNTNISSLQALIDAMQTGDYITNVTPLIESGTQVGYTISFLNGSPINIYHGAKGDKGETGANGTSPVIGVAQDPAYTDPDDPYYWTVDKLDGNGPQFLLASGNKIPVTGNNGQDAVAPLVRVNTTTNQWEISTDEGNNWTSTGVQATGDKGDKGAQGDSMFSDVDADTYEDYVVFTLADGTIVNIPKYKPIAISIQQPDNFDFLETKEIPYTISGETPAGMYALNIPSKWKVSIDQDQYKIYVTAPGLSDVDSENMSGEVVILVTDGGERTSVCSMKIGIDFTGSLKNVLGSEYYENGKLMGYVWKSKTISEDGLAIYKEYFKQFLLKNPYDQPDNTTVNLEASDADGQVIFNMVRDNAQYLSNLGQWTLCMEIGEDWFYPSGEQITSLSWTDFDNIDNPYFKQIGQEADIAHIGTMKLWWSFVCRVYKMENSRNNGFWDEWGLTGMYNESVLMRSEIWLPFKKF